MRKHILYFVLVFCFVLGFSPVTAFADDTGNEGQILLGHDFSGEGGICTECGKTKNELRIFDISEGKIEIRDDDDENGGIKVFVKNENSENSYVVSDIDPEETITVTGTTTEYELHVWTKTPVKIKAVDLTIDTSGRNNGAYAFLVAGIEDEADVTLILEGENYFEGCKAGITVDAGRSLTIEGDGSLTAYGNAGGAGIGGEQTNSIGGSITIQGDVKIIANSSGGAGIGDGFLVSGSTFTIGEGNPMIIASSISDHSNDANWHGLIFEGRQGKIYGTTFTLSRDFTIDGYKTLEIGEGQSLIIPEDITLILANNGTIVNNGNLIVDGAFVDENDDPVENVESYYPLTVNNGSAEGDIITNNGKSYAKAGSKITLKYTAPTGYKLSNWTSNDVKVTQSSFIMPASGVTVTANLEKIPEANKAPESTNIPAQSTTALRLQGTAAKTSIKMKWNAVPEADGYVIYGNNCSQKTVKQIGVVTGKTLSWTQKKLKKNSQNHYIVKAYKVVDGKQFFIQTSNEIHLVTKGGKYTNVKKLKSSASKVTLKKGKKKALKIKQTYAEKNKTLVKHMKSLSYTTSDQTVATVTKKSVVKAKGKGSCYIYITANSGVYTKVKVTVK